jgi:methionyl aminopeptidase
MSGHVCATPGCGQPAANRCPTCKDLSVPDTESHFCSKECFKGSWEAHKLIHAKYKEVQLQTIAAMQAAGLLGPRAGVRTPQKFSGFSFTGTLRPAEVSPQVKVPSSIQKPDYAETGIPKSELEVKGSNIIPVVPRGEWEHVRRAGELGREVLDIAAAALRPGITTDEIDKIVHAACMERSIYPSPLNYHGFPKSLCTSVNEVICHGIPDARPLQDGDIVNLDISIYYKGYHADLNETYTVGNVDERGKRLIKCAYECLAAAVAMCRPGVMYRDLGAAIEKVAKEYKYSVVKTYCGHGVGKHFHSAPNVPHYAKNKAVGIMRAGHVFTIEPMINEGVSGDELWPDQWTAVTVDGKRSAQFEHMLLITDDGVEILSARKGADRSKMVWSDDAIAAPFASSASAAASASSSSATATAASSTATASETSS